MRTLLVTLFAVALPCSLAEAQETPATPPARWDVTQARGTTRQIDFTTSEGTEISVDLSPDGRWIVFDLLGHVYRMPSTGGQAESLTQNSGVALNLQPRISPDGRHIAFVSDREGQNNLWIMNIDGSAPRAVFRDQNLRVARPVWTANGQFIVVTRSSTGGGGGEGQPAGGIWMYHRDGGDGVRLITDAGAVNPSVSPDGKFLYYQVRAGQGNDAVRGHLQIRRFEFANGAQITSRWVSATAQQPAAARAVAPLHRPYHRTDAGWHLHGQFRTAPPASRTTSWVPALHSGCSISRAVRSAW